MPTIPLFLRTCLLLSTGKSFLEHTCGQRWIIDQTLSPFVAIRMKARTENERQYELSLQCSNITLCEKVIISMSQISTNHIFLFPLMSIESSKLFIFIFIFSNLSLPHREGMESSTFIEAKKERQVVSLQRKTVLLWVFCLGTSVIL